MDICTVALFTNLMGHVCTAPMDCRTTADGLRQLCTPAVCPPEPLQWECKKPDGTTYIYIDVASGIPPVPH